ncbi:MAG: hypothetical protein NVS3B10_11540 [Polyangiales bacterium]
MPTPIRRSLHVSIAVLAMAVAQLPVTSLHAEGASASAAAKEKDEKPKGDPAKGEKDKDDKSKGDVPKGDVPKGDKDKGDPAKGEKDKGDPDKGDKDKGEKGASEKDDEEDVDEPAKPAKGEKGEKGEHKKSADDELFGPNDKDEADPARLEVHTKGERDSERARIAKLLDGKAMTDDLREELHRHALTIAKLQRIRLLARDSKDEASVGKARALLKKEKTRHGEFLSAYKAKNAGAK